MREWGSKEEEKGEKPSEEKNEVIAEEKEEERGWADVADCCA